MKTSVVVSTYNNPEALRLCLLSLAAQSILPAEVLIGDDGSSIETRNLVIEIKEELKNFFPIKHVWHEDNDFRKPKIMNDAVRASSGDYLIFIDGDCMAHRHFVKAHAEQSQVGTILGGRRVEIGRQLTERLIHDRQILNSFSLRLLIDAVMGDVKSRKVEEVFMIRNKMVRRLLHRDKITNDGIWGCNFSLHKELFLAINGYDEEFKYSVEDNDIGIRALNRGASIKSVRALAIVFHLWHLVRWDFNNEKYKQDRMILKRRIANKEMVCRNGIRKL